MSGCITSTDYIQLSMVGTPPSLEVTPILSSRADNGLQLIPTDGIFAPGILDIAGGDFPAAPHEGMLVKTSPSANVAWTFRYNPHSTATAKWEYVGGGDYHVDVETPGTINPGQPSGTWGAWTSIASPFVDFVAPFGGSYVIDFGATVDPINGEKAQVGLRINSGDPADDDTATFGAALTSSGGRGQQKTLNSGDLVRMLYRSTGGGPNNLVSTFRRRWMNVRPVRCYGSRAPATYGNT